MLSLGLHTCAVTRAMEDHLLDESPAWVVLRGEVQIKPHGYFLLASALDCPENCTVYVKAARRA